MSCLREAILMSTHNIGFYEEISKIITYHQISLNMHLISSASKHFCLDREGSGQTGQF